MGSRDLIIVIPGLLPARSQQLQITYRQRQKKKTKSLPNSFSSQRITTGKDSDDTDLLDNKHYPQLNPTGKVAAQPCLQRLNGELHLHVSG